MALLRIYILSSIGMVAGLLGLLFLSGGWQAVAAAFTIASGGLFLAILLALAIFRDRRLPPTPRYG